MNERPRHPPAFIQSIDLMTDSASASSARPTSSAARFLRVVLRVLLPVVVVFAGVKGARWMIESAPKAPQVERQRLARLVQYEVLQTHDEAVEIEAMGEVVAAREVAIHPRVAGEVVEISPELLPGGRLAAGALVARLDPADYDLGVRQQEAAVEVAAAELAIERSQQAIAREELALIKEPLGEEERRWVLREPQLAGAKARLAAAEASLAAARLQLERTEIRAPFDCMVLDRGLEVGAQATPASLVARVAGTAACWVELAVPADDLPWILFPAAAGDVAGSMVRVFDQTAGPEALPREGRVLRLVGGLDPASRVARVLVEVPDPLGLEPANAGRPPLLLNAFVRAEIVGRGLRGAIAVARRHLRDGNKVWVMGAGDRLEIRPVVIAHRGQSRVLVESGLAAGERLVVSDLADAVEGMALRGAPPARREGDKEAPRRVAGAPAAEPAVP
jgi:RND family efflux transporter MFP subunit